MIVVASRPPPLGKIGQLADGGIAVEHVAETDDETILRLIGRAAEDFRHGYALALPVRPCRGDSEARRLSAPLWVRHEAMRKGWSNGADYPSREAFEPAGRGEGDESQEDWPGPTGSGTGSPD